MDEEKEPKEAEKENEKAFDEIREMGTTLIQNARGTVECITVIGQIEGHNLLPPQNKTTKYEHLIPRIIHAEEDESVDGLLLILNTVGGDVEAGLALSELVAGMKKPTVSVVLGGGHSIGVPLAVSAKRSFIVPSAGMTIHPIRTNGLVIGVSQTFEYLNRLQDRIIRFVTGHANIDEEALRKLMLNTDELANDIGTVLFGEEAVEQGVIDDVGGIRQAMDALYSMIAENKKTDG